MVIKYLINPSIKTLLPSLLTGIKDRLMREFEQETELRVHFVRLSGRHAEEGAVEVSQVRDLPRAPREAVDSCVDGMKLIVF